MDRFISPYSLASSSFDGKTSTNAKHLKTHKLRIFNYMKSGEHLKIYLDDRFLSVLAAVFTLRVLSNCSTQQPIISTQIHKNTGINLAVCRQNPDDRDSAGAIAFT